MQLNQSELHILKTIRQICLEREDRDGIKERIEYVSTGGYVVCPWRLTTVGPFFRGLKASQFAPGQ
jgi:hypothetical protein